MPAPVTSHQAVLLQDGRVLVLGGESVPGWPVPWAQLYDPSTRAWSVAESMHAARIAESVTVLNDGRVLVVGGLNHTLKDLDSAEIFKCAGCGPACAWSSPSAGSRLVDRCAGISHRLPRVSERRSIVPTQAATRRKEGN
jgi:hypothetical protein